MEISASVDETNALRARLGLPPLAATPAPTQLADAADSEIVPSPFDLRSELARRRAVRESSRSVLGEPLADQLQFATAGSAQSWIERSKKLMEEEKQRQEQLSKSKASITTNNRTSTSDYQSSSLSGLKVKHNFEDFEDGEIVLTLADRHVLDDNKSDELENARIVEAHRATVNQQRRAHKDGRGVTFDYDSFDDDSASLLSKYDDTDSDANAGFVLGSNGVYQKSYHEHQLSQAEATRQQERLAMGLDSGSRGIHYDLISSASVTMETDFKPVKFKKKKSKSEARHGVSISSDDGSDFIRSAVTLSGTVRVSDSDHSKSGESTNSLVPDHRQQGFLNALNKSNAATAQRVESDRQQQRQSLQSMLADVDEESEVLTRVIQQSRRLATDSGAAKHEGKIRFDPIRAIADRIKQEAASQQEDESIQVKRENDSSTESKMADNDDSANAGVIVLSATTSFATSLMVDNDEDDRRLRRTRIKQEMSAPVSDADAKADITADSDDTAMFNYESESGIKSAAEVEGEEKDDEGSEESDDDDEDELFGAEPLAGDSVASALQFAKHRAYLNAGSQSRDRVDLTRYDALGRPMSQKEQFRELSHQFHGQGAGLTKRDKRMKALVRQQRANKSAVKGVSVADRKTLLQYTQEKLGMPFIVLEGNNAAQRISASVSTSSAAAVVPPPSSHSVNASTKNGGKKRKHDVSGDGNGDARHGKRDNFQHTNR